MLQNLVSKKGPPTQLNERTDETMMQWQVSFMIIFQFHLTQDNFSPPQMKEVATNETICRRRNELPQEM